MRRKIKTSVSISPKAHNTIRKIAKSQDRSVSYVLEKFIEERAARIAEEPDQKKHRGTDDASSRGYGKKKTV